jgi:hypothetical protein
MIVLLVSSIIVGCNRSQSLRVYNPPPQEYSIDNTPYLEIDTSDPHDPFTADKEIFPTYLDSIPETVLFRTYFPEDYNPDFTYKIWEYTPAERWPNMQGDLADFIMTCWRDSMYQLRKVDSDCGNPGCLVYHGPSFDTLLVRKDPTFELYIDYKLGNYEGKRAN